jgi:hypothetical protein
VSTSGPTLRASGLGWADANGGQLLMVTYTVVPDGGFTGVVTVNTTAGVRLHGAGGRRLQHYSTYPVKTTHVHVFSVRDTAHLYPRRTYCNILHARAELHPYELVKFGLDQDCRTR